MENDPSREQCVAFRKSQEKLISEHEEAVAALTAKLDRDWKMLHDANEACINNQHAEIKALTAENARLRTIIEGMILYFETHGKNVDPPFHIAYLTDALGQGDKRWGSPISNNPIPKEGAEAECSAEATKGGGE